MTRSNATAFWSSVNGRVKLTPRGGCTPIVVSMSVGREVRPRINAWRVTATLVGALILGGCNQEDATARLANDIHPDKVEIIHARFPCRSPEIHFFGYRFRILVKTEMALGDICWDPLAKEWTWQILPEHGLSRLKPRK
jgi:hypothetical protein